MKKMTPAILLILSGCFYETYDRRAVAPAPPPLTAPEVQKLAEAGVSEPVILEAIDQRGAKPLSADDIVALKAAGASDAVIAKMQATERKEPQVVYVDSPVYYHYSYGPYYPWWGFSYGYWGRRGGGGIRVGW